MWDSDFAKLCNKSDSNTACQIDLQLNKILCKFTCRPTCACKHVRLLYRPTLSVERTLFVKNGSKRQKHSRMENGVLEWMVIIQYMANYTTEPLIKLVLFQIIWSK